MPDIKTIADKADVIINGYAFTRENTQIHVLNLNSPDKAAVFGLDSKGKQGDRFSLRECGDAILFHK